MKVRITDLLDQYYDKSVKLDPPPEALPGQYRPQPRRSRAQKPLLVAATLMLVLTGIAGLTLGFQRLGTTGHALAGEENPVSVQEQAAVVTVTPEPEVAVEAAPEPTIAASAWEDDGQEAPRIPFEVSGYTQQGNKLQFSLRVHDVPVGYTVKLQPGDVYSNIINEAQVEDVTGLLLGEGWEESGERLIDATLELTEAGGPLVFRVACCDENDNWVFTETTSIPVAGFDSLVSWYANGLHEYCMEVPSSVFATVKQLTVTENTLEFLIEAPADVELVEGEIDLTDETLVREAGDWANTLVSNTQSELFHIYMNDGSVADITAEDYDCALISAGLSGEKGVATVNLTIDLAEPIDPLAIDMFEFSSQEVLPEITRGPVNAEDPNGDGLLMAHLELPINPDDAHLWAGTLLKLTIDLSNGDYTWHYTHTELEQMLYDLSPAGDLSEALHDETFMQEATALSNNLIETYFKNAYLVFSDGTRLCLGSGAEEDFEDGVFTTTYNLASCAEDYGLPINGLAVDHLEINGEAYSFE